MNKPRIAVVFGTRPEAIKVVSVIKELQKHADLFTTITVSTGQHRQMLDQILSRFSIQVDHEMQLMEPNQTLYRLSSKAIASFEQVIESAKPSMLLVQGDTTTAFLGALCAFYGRIPVGHIEAGMRTNNKYFPFPEEINRRLITVTADLHFAATDNNRRYLLKENIDPSTISVTGNTVIDTLLMATAMDHPFPLPRLDPRKRLILVTIHRRESFGEPLEQIFQAIRSIAVSGGDLEIVYPVHLNPNVRTPAHAILGNLPNVHLIDPLDYLDLVQLMRRSYLILTDSGGIQEEAPTLGVPVLVARNETERPEAVEAGTVLLVGTDKALITRTMRMLLDNKDKREAMARATNPYGDGKAAPRIVQEIKRYFGIPVAAAVLPFPTGKDHS